MNKVRISFTLATFIFFLNCAGIYNKPILIEKKSIPVISKNIRFEFTGFYFYNKELQLLKKEILQTGFVETPNSPLLLEVLLEEKEVDYKHELLHAGNFVVSLFTVGIIPYYTITQHKITYRFSENAKLLGSSTQILELDQLRGLSMLPITYFFWPSTAFDKSILDSWKIHEEIK
jgi:outer membrane receptor for Fe3+-dicitrate